MVPVTLYTKVGCCLCDDVKRVLQGETTALNLMIREIDIESDPALFEAHRYEIPVVFLGAHKAFKYRVTREELHQRVARMRASGEFS